MNGKRDVFCKIFRKKPITKYPVIAAAKHPIKQVPIPTSNWTECFITFKISSKPAPKITGVPKRKEKRAASSREYPNVLPTPIVAPERETPGISAQACPIPIATASLLEIFSWRFSFLIG